MSFSGDPVEPVAYPDPGAGGVDNAVGDGVDNAGGDDGGGLERGDAHGFSEAVAQEIEAHEPGGDTLMEWIGSPISEYLSDIIRTPGYHGPGSGCDDRMEPNGFCEAGHVQIGAKSPCTNRGCPHHWPRWRRERARSMVARLAAVRYLAGEGAQRRLVHLMTAPPQERRWTTRTFWEHRSEAYETAEEVGARGAYCIPHAYRPSDAGNELWRWLGGPSQATAGTVQRGKWRAFREFSGDDWDAMQPLIEVAPHTHQLAIARDIDGETAKEIEEEAGWVVENIRSLASFYVNESEVPPMAVMDDNGRIVRSETEVVQEGYASMARLVFYLLEHASVQPETGDLPQRDSVTSWGEVNTVTPAEELPAEVWKEILERVEAALPGRRREEDEKEDGGRVCQREGCEEVVSPISQLRDRMADPDHSWWRGLDFEQQCELLGVSEWMGTKPPPGIEAPQVEMEPEWVGGEERPQSSALMPPGGFGRSPSIRRDDQEAGVLGAVPTDGVGLDGESRADVIEWLRRIGRARYQRMETPILTAMMEAPAEVGGR